MRKTFSILLIVTILSSCTEKHFISDSSYRRDTQNKFELRKEQTKIRADELYGVFNQDINLEETEALQFLYAYSPLCDLADYDGGFFLKQVKSSFEARDYFSWGKDIPEDIFRHFVLPFRVNNENPDSARQVFFSELKERISHLDMEEASLEVNHWCHEKVNYHPADIRTSGPLATVKTAYGRCGEESTFTVSALRSVSIPARQVYTPRWAHSDDNHAWVEVWINGKWEFLGACEPASRLNEAWFTEPAKRAMMVHTKAFGKYISEGEILFENENYSIINTLSKYADTKKINVIVNDINGNPVSDARVNFGLFNYNEFYPIASLMTSESGKVSLTTGKGSLMLEAVKGDLRVTEFIRTDSLKTYILRLDSFIPPSEPVFYHHLPPIEATPSLVNTVGLAENNIRLLKEDSIRNAYVEGFISKDKTDSLAQNYGLDKNIFSSLMKQSRGNWKSILSFVENTKEEQLSLIIPLLEVISKKDLRDVNAEILNENLEAFAKEFGSSPKDNSAFLYKYILNPRIKNEMLTNYKTILNDNFSWLLKENPEKRIEEVIKWIKKNIDLNETENYYNLPISPVGVYNLQISNRESRDIFFVALCRSLNIDARLRPHDQVPQYFMNNEWIQVFFEDSEAKTEETGQLVLFKNSEYKWFDPAYGIHFSIERYNHGAYKSLDFGIEKRLSSFEEKLELEQGNYRILSGVRNFDGSVLVRTENFRIIADENQELEIIFPESDEQNAQRKTELPSLNFLNKTGDDIVSGENQIIAWIQPGDEPTEHFLHEINALRKNFKNWGGELVFSISDKHIPENISHYISFIDHLDAKIVNDPEAKNLNKLFDAGILTKLSEFPIIVATNSLGELVYYSSGYRVGIADMILLKLD